MWRHNLISQDHCRILSHGMLFFSHETCILSTSNNSIFFQTSLSNDFEVIYENPLQAPEYLQSHVSYTLSNSNSSSTQLKVLWNLSKITNFVFPYIASSVECISKFLKIHLIQVQASVLNAVSYGLNHWETFYNAFVLKHKKRKCISPLQRCCPFNNCKDVKALLSAFNNKFRNSFFIDIHEIL